MTTILDSRSMITAGGTETFLIFQQGTELRQFCGFELFQQPEELLKLENDFYITARDDGFVFFSRILRLWWKARYGFQGI